MTRTHAVLIGLLFILITFVCIGIVVVNRRSQNNDMPPPTNTMHNRLAGLIKEDYLILSYLREDPVQVDFVYRSLFEEEPLPGESATKVDITLWVMVVYPHGLPGVYSSSRRTSSYATEEEYPILIEGVDYTPRVRLFLQSLLARKKRYYLSFNRQKLGDLERERRAAIRAGYSIPERPAGVRNGKLLLRDLTLLVTRDAGRCIVPPDRTLPLIEWTAPGELPTPQDLSDFRARHLLSLAAADRDARETDAMTHARGLIDTFRRNLAVPSPSTGSATPPAPPSSSGGAAVVPPPAPAPGGGAAVVVPVPPAPAKVRVILNIEGGGKVKWNGHDFTAGTFDYPKGSPAVLVAVDGADPFKEWDVDGTTSSDRTLKVTITKDTVITVRFAAAPAGGGGT